MARAPYPAPGSPSSGPASAGGWPVGGPGMRRSPPATCGFPCRRVFPGRVGLEQEPFGYSSIPGSSSWAGRRKPATTGTVWPQKPAILPGAQDMLLSPARSIGATLRAMRGGPRIAAVPNNDCLWVFDEVQLMSTGFATSLQLESWRDCSGMKPAIASASWWMSASLEPEWLASAVDFVPSIAGVCNDSDGQTKLLWNADAKGHSDSATSSQETAATWHQNLPSPKPMWN